MKRNMRTRLFLAIGRDGVTAVVDGQSRPLVVERGASMDGETPPLTSAFAQIAAQLRGTVGDTTGATIDVAIMPSLCDVRMIALPPMRKAEAQAVIARDSARYFQLSNEVRVVGVMMPRKSRGGSATATPPVLAASVAQSLLEDIAAAAASTGWSVRRVVAAYASWLHAVTSADDTEVVRAFVATEGAHSYVARVEHNAPVQLRRLNSSQHDAIAAAAGAGPGAATLFADEHPLSASSMSAAGWRVVHKSLTAAAVAAENAGQSGLELVSPAGYAAKGLRQRALANRLAAAAVVLAISAAAVSWWGARRELETVQAARASIRSRVAPLLELRDSVDRMESRVRETNALFDGGPRWGKTLYEISVLLPPDAHLVRVNATGDTIVFEVEGARAGDALEAISRAPTLRDVRMDGPVQRELAEGTTAKERFVIQATLASAPRASAESSSSSQKRRVQPPAARTISDRDLGGRLP